MKKLISIILLSTLLFQAQAKAGVIIALAAVGISNRAVDAEDYRLKRTIVIGGVASFVVVMATGVTLTILGIVGGSMPFFILAEDGSLNQNELETKLSEKYPFLADRETISELAHEISTQAKKMDFDTDGKKIVHLQKSKIESILLPLDLKKEEIKLIINDLE